MKLKKCLSMHWKYFHIPNVYKVNLILHPFKESIEWNQSEANKMKF